MTTTTTSLQKLFEKEPPVALDIEASVLGALILDHVAIPQAMKILRGPGDFSHPGHAAIYETILSEYASNGFVDLQTLASALKKRNLFDQVGGADYIVELHEQVPSARAVEHHARIVREKAALRQAIGAAGQVLDKAYNSGMSATEIAYLAMSAFHEITPPPPTQLTATTGNAAQDLWDASPPEIRRIFRSLKTPSDARKRGILLSDPCKLLLAYAIAGTLASKKIRVSNAHMLASAEHFYTNHFCFFVNNSGDSKTGTSGIIQEFVQTFDEAIAHGQLRPCLESGMATGPVLVIKDCFGTHDDRIKARANGTGMILPHKPGQKKDEEVREVTAHDMREAREAYKEELWEKRDKVRPVIFVVDELAEKLANVAGISNGTLIDIHSSGPHVRTEGKYNGVGTCYGYGACISIFGNMQKSLAAEMFYNPKNASSGLQGRCLPLSNDFQSDIALGDDIPASQEDTARWLAGEWGAMPVNYIDAYYPSFDDAEIRAMNNGYHGIEFNKFHIMTQRLLAPLFAWAPENIQAAYSACLRLLVDLYPHAFNTGVQALSQSIEVSSVGRLSSVISRKINGNTSVRTRDIAQGFSGQERHGKTEEINAWFMANGGWLPIQSKTRKDEIVGWVRK